ncbi:hypothetical protein DB30_01758 [Enhygromyxa salina]|uniref:Uncharacterized protein n=1 Tax=Enhygromyxa salina TaxID=215803 RepID=A0A0C2CLZ9_9BACT|nr:hypothetical protein [Enhygromyxa salina]KIG12251.1 hypothetical protein DB30_01758 [Enhygromyxa salina]
MRSDLARFVLGFVGPLILAGCTAPPPAAESLPGADVARDVSLDYRVRPELAKPEAPPPEPEPEPEPEPDSDSDFDEAPERGWGPLVAGHPAHTRFAISDRQRLWIGKDNAVRELERNADATASIEDMVMDAQGVVWLLMSDNTLARVNDHDGIEAAPLPVAHASSIHAGAGHIVVLGVLPEATPLPPPESVEGLEYEALDERAVMAVTQTGTDWTLRRRPEDLSEFDDLAIGPDGSLMLMDGAEAGCGGGWQSRWQGHLSEPTWTMLPWPHDDSSSRVAASGGWSYGFQTCDEGEPEGLCAVDEAGRGVFVLDVNYDPYAIGHTEGVTMVASAAGLWRVQGSKAQRIGEGLEAPFRGGAPVMAISDGRVILVVGSRVYIGAAEGWTELSLA